MRPLFRRPKTGRTASASRDVVALRTTAGSGKRDMDFGVVVGVEHYPYYRPLHGAAKDARNFLAWLCDEKGGGVRRKHARLILSNLAKETPVQDEIDRMLVEVLEAARASKRARRLYFYFSGHGAANQSSSDDVALLLTRWSSSLERLALSTEQYSHTLRGAGLFEEVAIFVDCCRSFSASAIGLPPTIRRTWEAPCSTRRFIAFASEAGQPAYSAPATAKWEGIFTRCLLSILRREPRGVPASALKDYLETEVEIEAMRFDIRQRAHADNGFLAGSSFGRAGQPPVLTLVFVKRRGAVVLSGGNPLRIIATHVASREPWRLQLAVGLYMLEGGNQDPVYFRHDGTGMPRDATGAPREL
jgi:hypothetical protein